MSANRRAQLRAALNEANLGRTGAYIAGCTLIGLADPGTGLIPDRCQPTLTALARLAGQMPQTTLRTSLRHLQQHGWITHRRGGGPGNPNRFELHTGSPCDCVPERTRPASQAERARQYRARRKAALTTGKVTIPRNAGNAVTLGKVSVLRDANSAATPAGCSPDRHARGDNLPKVSGPADHASGPERHAVLRDDFAGQAGFALYGAEASPNGADLSPRRARAAEEPARQGKTPAAGHNHDRRASGDPGGSGGAGAPPVITSTPSPAAVNALRGKIANPAISPRPGDTPGAGSHALLNGRGTSTRPAVPADTRTRARPRPEVVSGNPGRNPAVNDRHPGPPVNPAAPGRSLPAAYPAASRQLVHLAAAGPFVIPTAGRHLHELARRRGQPLCWQQQQTSRRRWRPPQPAPGAAVTCTRCKELADRYGVTITDAPRPPVPRLRPVRFHHGRGGYPVHLAAAGPLRTARITRAPGQLLCWRPASRSYPAPPGAAVTCRTCATIAAQLGWRPPAPPRPRCAVPGCPFRAPCPEHDRPDPLPRDPWAGLRDRIAASIAEAAAHPELPAELPAGLAAVRSSTGLVHAIAAAPLVIARDGSAAEVRRDPGQLLCATRCPPATCPAGGWPTCGLCSARAARIAAELAASQPAAQATR